MTVNYIPSDFREVQGSREVIYKKYGKEWKISPQG